MPFMASVKRHALACGALFLVTAYMAVSLFDFFADSIDGRKATVHAHLENLRAERFPVSGLILGGSNAYYGLSAKLLEEELDFGFYNASLSSEGFTKSGYDKFIRTTIPKHIAAANVRLIVYSSVLPLRAGAIAAYKSATNRSLWGGTSLGIKRHKSIYKEHMDSFLKSSSKKPAKPARYPLPDFRGDLNFSTVVCAHAEQEPSKGMEDVLRIVAFFADRVKILRQAFPHAQIVFVLPSEYHAEESPPTSGSDALKALFDKTLKGKARLIVQPPIPTLALVCNETYHPNETGRSWRTRDLVKSLKELSLIKR